MGCTGAQGRSQDFTLGAQKLSAGGARRRQRRRVERGCPPPQPTRGSEGAS